VRNVVLDTRRREVESSEVFFPEHDGCLAVVSHPAEGMRFFFPPRQAWTGTSILYVRIRWSRFFNFRGRKDVACPSDSVASGLLLCCTRPLSGSRCHHAIWRHNPSTVSSHFGCSGADFTSNRPIGKALNPTRDIQG
jgi:hypothetical protein